ncbi:ribokinase [Planococcus liqunii]|uniref:Ribokinase n=1 Tax=Planococcus liqunii TaxID=3058394 RepID=A0ABT8MRS5_9BACL|nr:MULTISPECIES: ribokinase [unclassified Planococcus (in: firmicutes)]MDN7227610.1 ribokinase [Planococcus sp. N064]WKA50493.1 ribokinase [Planococcus sp. N056]
MITVVGSINMDLVVRTNRFPKQGETALGDLYTTVPGGKGANQAVAAARLGSEVHMIGAVGTDAFGDELLAGLKAESIQVNNVKRVEGTSGIANILLSEGDNRIIVVPGANHQLTAVEMEAFETQLANSQMVIMQLEIPIPVIQRTLEICHQHGVPTILNPAPATGFTDEFLPYATYLTPNETEAEEMFGQDWEAALEQYPNRLVVTIGQKGARYFDGSRHVTVEGFATEAVDTTGAGDTFNGALGVALAESMPFEEAVRFANAAASLSVEKFGAQGGMPKRQEVLARLGGREL